MSDAEALLLGLHPPHPLRSRGLEKEPFLSWCPGGKVCSPLLPQATLPLGLLEVVVQSLEGGL